MSFEGNSGQQTGVILIFSYRKFLAFNYTYLYTQRPGQSGERIIKILCTKCKCCIHLWDKNCCCFPRCFVCWKTWIEVVYKWQLLCMNVSTIFEFKNYIFNTNCQFPIVFGFYIQPANMRWLAYEFMRTKDSNFTPCSSHWSQIDKAGGVHLRKIWYLFIRNHKSADIKISPFYSKNLWSLPSQRSKLLSSLIKSRYVSQNN